MERKRICFCDECYKPIYEGDEYLFFQDGPVAVTIHTECKKDFAFRYVNQNKEWEPMRHDFELDKLCMEYLQNCFSEVE